MRAEVQVAATTLDALAGLYRRPDLVKIDTEGAELLCLRGASRLLGEARPRLLCEVGAANGPEVGALLRDHDYFMFDASLPKPQRVPLTVPAWNTLALP